MRAQHTLIVEASAYVLCTCTKTETNCISDVMDNVTMTNNHSVTYSQEFYWL